MDFGIYHYKNIRNISFYLNINKLGKSASIVAVKLELGSEQTLAHKEGDTWVLNDPPPDPALELEKCQRYFERVYLNTGFPFACTASNKLKANVFYKVRKRATPSIKYYPMYIVRQKDNSGVFGNNINTIPADGGKSVDSCTIACTEEQINSINVGEFAYLGIGDGVGLTYFDVSSDL